MLTGTGADASVLMRPGEVAALFGVTSKTVARWGRLGILAPVRTPGGHMRFRSQEVRALVSKGAVAATE
jgi:excisionase family DNA binding protein